MTFHTARSVGFFKNIFSNCTQIIFQDLSSAGSIYLIGDQIIFSQKSLQGVNFKPLQAVFPLKMGETLTALD